MIDDPDALLSGALHGALARCDVEIARDVFDAIDRIECNDDPYVAIFCDLARSDLPGPELWSYLAAVHPDAAARIVFVASGPVPPQTRSFLHQVPNPFLALPLEVLRIEELFTDEELPTEARAEGTSEGPDAFGMGERMSAELPV